MLLKNKVAVIYGAGGAIGGAVAETFAREGAPRSIGLVGGSNQSASSRTRSPPTASRRTPPKPTSSTRRRRKRRAAGRQLPGADQPLPAHAIPHGEASGQAHGEGRFGRVSLMNTPEAARISLRFPR